MGDIVVQETKRFQVHGGRDVHPEKVHANESMVLYPFGQDIGKGSIESVVRLIRTREQGSSTHGY